MSNGTFYLVSSDPSVAGFPEIRMMTSTGLPAFNTPENIALREPTELDMAIITPDGAKRRWGRDPLKIESHRVWSVEGITVSSIP